MTNNSCIICYADNEVIFGFDEKWKDAYKLTYIEFIKIKKWLDFNVLLLNVR